MCTLGKSPLSIHTPQLSRFDSQVASNSDILERVFFNADALLPVPRL